MRHANWRRYTAMMRRLVFDLLSPSSGPYRSLCFVLQLPRADRILVAREERAAEIEGR
jgi:hypothetical protein